MKILCFFVWRRVSKHNGSSARSPSLQTNYGSTLLLRWRFLATTSATLAITHVPDLAALAMSSRVKACPLVFGTIARSSFTRRLVVAAFVPAVVGSASHHRHDE
jgi:hypothetical protein